MLNVKIRVKNHLDPHWSEWLEGLSIAHTDENQTVLSGTVADESALYGLLTKLRNLGLALVSVSSAEIDKAPLPANKENG